MTPSSGDGNQLLRDLAKRAKKARQEGKAPDNEAAIRDHNERLAGCYPLLAVAFVVIALVFIMSLLS